MSQRPFTGVWVFEQHFLRDDDPKDYDPADYDPADYDPADYDPADYDPADYDPADYDPADCDPTDCDPTDCGFVKVENSDFSSFRPHIIQRYKLQPVKDTDLSVNPVNSIGCGCPRIRSGAGLSSSRRKHGDRPA